MWRTARTAPSERPLDDRQSGPEPPLLPIQGRWSEEDRDLVDRFVATHFGLRGTLRLHRNAIGWDLLRAPANVPLAPVYLLLRLAALLLKLTGLRRAARWLAGRRIFFRSAIARSVGGAVIDELVRPRLPDGTAPRHANFASSTITPTSATPSPRSAQRFW